MHTHSIDPWTHRHVFLGERHARNERRIGAVVALTAATMVAEIVGGTLFGSMALTADGWHMSTHAAALGIAALAYRYARRHAHDPRFTFGTGKLGELAAFASAIILVMIALLIGAESLGRLMRPVEIGFAQALPIAGLGLAVNLASVFILHDGDHGHHHSHHHGPDHAHHPGDDHGHHGPRDTNFRAAYLHVMADTLTSVLAIAALLGGQHFGLAWLDPAMGLVGAAVIVSWAIGLIRTSGAVLLDRACAPETERAVRQRLERDGDRVCDLHLWQIGPGHRAAVVSLVTDDPRAPAFYKARLAGLPELSHVTVEVQPCRHPAPAG